VTSEKGLVKIAAPLHSLRRWKHETLWALPLGGDRFEIRNIPWLRDDLHAGDVVRCKTGSAGFPEIVELVEASGHETLHLIFTEHADDKLREEVLALVERTVGYTERASEDGWAVDVNPGTDLPSLLEYLGRLQAEGLLEGKPVQPQS
jgi:hypothetical protein